MPFKCFWRIFMLATIVSVVQADTEKLFCVKHSGEMDDLDTCSLSKGRSISAAALTNSSNGSYSTQQNRISFELICKADPTTCAGVSSTFSIATDIISSVFQFETPLLINASYIDFCQEYNDCNSDNSKMTSIGQAYPAISYVMTDTTDNMTRMYPQPLLKQFTDLTTKPTWTKYDINAQFNSLVNWYFINDQQSIGENQTDFLRNVLHELIHGLGFITSWSDDVYRAITPLFTTQIKLKPFITPILLASTNNEQLLNGYSNPLPFWGFVEFPFDKFINYKTSSGAFYPFSKITRQLNEFSNSNATFRNLIDLANSWYNSDAYSQASIIYGRSISSLDILAVLGDDQYLWLESSVNPYSTGSSLCHVDQSSYLNSKEYLMVYLANHGVGISQLNQLYPTGPIGPTLQNVMGTLGYRLTDVHVKTTRPKLTYWRPPPGLVGTDSNPHPSLTINTNGPAQSPIVPSSSVSTSPSASSTPNSTSHKWFYSPFLYIIILVCTLLI
ncbi:unnamed protein product [Mucor hiemalis]